MTITLSEDIAPSTVDRLLKYLRQEKVAFALQDNLHDEEAVRIASIRERLRLKYVQTGQWETMNDEDRQDAALLEGMLYDDETGKVELLNAAEQIEFKNEMKSWMA
jgi:succinylglutamate desuccinylase